MKIEHLLDSNQKIKLLLRRIRTAGFILLLCFYGITGVNAQNSGTLFPKTAAAVVGGFYHELALKPDNVSHTKHAAEVFDKYFSDSYQEIGGKGNKHQDFNQFRSFITTKFKQLPDLNVKVEELIESGNMVAVKIRLFDKKAGAEINYVALYYVKDGKIQARYAYSDGGF